MVAPRRGASSARLGIALALAATLALALFAALSPTTAQAGCPICDQYTLDIPDPTNGGGTYGGNEPEPEPTTPAPAPAPATTTVPATTVPETVVPTTAPDAPVKDTKKAKPKPPPFVPVRVDGPPETGTALTSTPLSYEGEDSAPAAALAGLGSPGTIALLAALVAAGAAIAVGRRRSIT